jgi:hypothetical protein
VWPRESGAGGREEPNVAGSGHVGFLMALSVGAAGPVPSSIGFNWAGQKPAASGKSWLGRLAPVRVLDSLLGAHSCKSLNSEETTGKVQGQTLDMRLRMPTPVRTRETACAKQASSPISVIQSGQSSDSAAVQCPRSQQMES